MIVLAKNIKNDSLNFVVSKDFRSLNNGRGKNSEKFDV